MEESQAAASFRDCIAEIFNGGTTTAFSQRQPIDGCHEYITVVAVADIAYDTDDISTPQSFANG